MKIVLHDNGLHLRFAPLTLTRPVGDLRIGGMTNVERWKLVAPGAEVYFETEAYLQGVFPATDAADLVINAALIPNEEVAAVILNLQENEILFNDETWLAKRGDASLKVIYKGEHPVILRERWDLFRMNGAACESDFALLTEGKVSQELSDSNVLIGPPENLFIEEGAVIEGAIINCKTGPVYVAKGAEIMEGSLVRGPLMMNEGSALKMGAKVYGPTTLGPHCKVGGEVNNVVFQGYSNKGHDGFLGNSVIGEWCNLGADTNSSNLKNNYGLVSTYSYETGKEEQTDVQFMGLIMGDHSKCGINTMFNTATVVGVSCNVFGADFPEKFIPSFSWGGKADRTEFRLDKAIEFANNMMARRGRELSKGERQILTHLFGLK
jgi:UDP-N-acetylglucosamine diphosphorylase/glucosamine-1-phosphate N-acetyltransferase